MAFTLNVDKHLNPYIPRSIVPCLPPFLSRWLGAHKPVTIPDYVLWLDIFIGSFVSILTIEATFMHSSVFIAHHAPIIIASYGASAILAFNANGVPLAQPRNLFLGHFFSAVIGVCIQKLFGLSQAGRDHFYVGGALSVGVASVVMLVTNTVHPPSGASALIPVIDDGVREMGWWYIPAHLVSSVLMIGIACVTNNVLRKYPMYWWTAYKRPDPVVEDVEQQRAHVNSNNGGDKTDSVDTQVEKQCFIVTTDELSIPEGVVLNEEELRVVEVLQKKLRRP